MSKKNPYPKLQCIVCENWAVPTHPSQQKNNFTCDPFCREFARKFNRRSAEYIRIKWKEDMRDQKIWTKFCFTPPEVYL